MPIRADGTGSTGGVQGLMQVNLVAFVRSFATTRRSIITHRISPYLSIGDSDYPCMSMTLMEYNPRRDLPDNAH